MASNPDFVQDYFFIEGVDERDYLSALVSKTYKALPQPKPKKKKNEKMNFSLDSSLGSLFNFAAA